jgi:hypothetical protein
MAGRPTHTRKLAWVANPHKKICRGSGVGRFGVNVNVNVNANLIEQF